MTGFEMNTSKYADRKAPLADACIKQGSLEAWVCSNQKQQITLFNASYTGVQQVIRAQVSSGCGTEFRVDLRLITHIHIAYKYFREEALHHDLEAL